MNEWMNDGNAAQPTSLFPQFSSNFPPKHFENFKEKGSNEMTPNQNEILNI